MQGVVGGTYPQPFSFLLSLVRQKKSNHSFSIVTGGRHLGGWLFVYNHFPPRRQIVDTFQALRLTLSD
ncbi:hypothetical protein E2C01_046373 [Portunus trituberculatus]|uniref:Uncharacterized protein n=1 Tax=Portunus trituberculatus TaxID=210409 RepID=A0A5B7G5L7_PORTR|nr:hypothetical protein [Portunus trituberculatus]